MKIYNISWLAFDELNKYFTICGITVASSQYWNSIHGREKGQASEDLEGLQTMRTLARNMTFLMKSISNGLLVGEIINISADESVVTDGAVDITKVKPISFDPFGNAYFGVGAKVGNAFKDGMALK